jgi:hypothetical protein
MLPALDFLQNVAELGLRPAFVPGLVRPVPHRDIGAKSRRRC